MAWTSTVPKLTTTDEKKRDIFTRSLTVDALKKAKVFLNKRGYHLGRLEYEMIREDKRVMAKLQGKKLRRRYYAHCVEHEYCIVKGVIENQTRYFLGAEAEKLSIPKGKTSEVVFLKRIIGSTHRKPKERNDQLEIVTSVELLYELSHGSTAEMIGHAYNIKFKTDGNSVEMEYGYDENKDNDDIRQSVYGGGGSAGVGQKSP